MNSRRLALLAASACLPMMQAQAQDVPADWHFPLSYDSVKADPKNHRILFEDAKLRLIEVTLFPGDKEVLHGHPYPSVFAVDAVFPKMKDEQLDPAASRDTKIGGRGGPPPGKQYPTCLTMGPQAPHAATVTEDFPQHFYRIEFKRIDGDHLAANWKTWYPWMLEPLKPVKDLVPGPNLGPPLSADWPFPLAYDSYKAAPNNHYLRYEDNHIRFIEVVMRPGEKENMHGHPYPSVFAMDGARLGGQQPRGTRPAVTDTPLEPNSPLNSPTGSPAPAPQGYQGPSCNTMGPQAPHQAQNLADTPAHFYRIEFKRVDGQEFKTKWREWYPWMAQSKPPAFAPPHAP